MLDNDSSSELVSSNRDGLLPASKFLHIPMHENTGTSLGYTTHNGTGTLTWANQWNDYRVNPDGSTAIAVNDQRFDDIFNLSTLNGGLLILCSITWSTVPSTAEKIFQYGAPSRTSPGGIILEVNATNAQFITYPKDNTVNTANTLKPHASAEDAVMTVCGYIDIYNKLIVLGINGVWRNVDEDAADMAGMIDNNKLCSTTDGSYAFSLFGQNGADGTINGQQINSGSGALKVSDFWAVRFETDKLTDIPKIFREYNQMPRSKLYTLDGQ